MKYLGYILGVLMIVVGALVLAGFFQLRGMAPGESGMFRTIFGIVLMLYGIYRISVSEYTRRRKLREGE